MKPISFQSTFLILQKHLFNYQTFVLEISIDFNIAEEKNGVMYGYEHYVWQAICIYMIYAIYRLFSFPLKVYWSKWMVLPIYIVLCFQYTSSNPVRPARYIQPTCSLLHKHWTRTKTTLYAAARTGRPIRGITIALPNKATLLSYDEIRFAW